LETNSHTQLSETEIIYRPIYKPVMNKTHFAAYVAAGLLASTFILSCKKDASIAETSTKRTTPRGVVKSDSFNNHATDGATYSQADYTSAFGTWESGAWADGTRTKIYTVDDSNVLRVKLMSGELSSNSGVIALTNIVDHTGYAVKFDVKFREDFDFGKGGKVGLGLGIGNVRTGLNRYTMDSNDGGSARLMWYTSDGVTKFKPYVYSKDFTASEAGGSEFPITQNQWYTVVIKVISNTVGQQNGQVYYGIKKRGAASFTPVLNRSDMVWSTQDYNRKITRLMFDTFRGGNTDDWKVYSDEYIYFDNLQLEEL
jgi:hypothetical protein